MNDSHYNKHLKDFAREHRNNSTFGEILLWKKLLSRKKTGHQFNRQFPIDDFIVDFISRKLRLVIEVDGTYHDNVYEKDVERDQHLNAIGYTVLRFSERDVRFNFDNVSRAILIWIHEFEKNNGINPPNPLLQGGKETAAPELGQTNRLPHEGMVHLEIACFSSQDAITAQQAGADRIELCENYSVGGITPSESEIKHARENLQIDLFVMIRPRAGNFNYSAEEFETMKQQILLCKKIKCNGLVFGILDEKSKVDTACCMELVELAKPLQCTFHKAFDETENAFEAMEEIIECGFTRILTSGQEPTTIEGVELIKQLIKKAKGRIIVMPGGGVRFSNAFEIINETGAKEIHSAAMNKETIKIDLEEIKRIQKRLPF